MDPDDTEIVKTLLKWYSDGMGAHAADYQQKVRDFIKRIQPNMVYTTEEGSMIEEAIQVSCCDIELSEDFIKRWAATVWVG